MGLCPARVGASLKRTLHVGSKIWILCSRGKNEILVLPREHKIHIFEPPCNILYITLHSGVLFVGAAHFAVSWYTVVWLKLISYISVNMWNRLGLVNSPSKSGEYRILNRRKLLYTFKMLYSQLSPSELPANTYGSGSLGKNHRPPFSEILVSLLQTFNYLRSFRLQVVSPTW